MPRQASDAALYRMRAPAQDHFGGVLTRTAYANLKAEHTRIWGQQSLPPFPRSMDHTTVPQCLDFLSTHITLFERARALPSEVGLPYIQLYREWVRLACGRLPLRMRRYLGLKYRRSVKLRLAELHWAELGDYPLERTSLFEEMDAARAFHPNATDWTSLVESARSQGEL